MKPGAPRNRISYACFACRKAFKFDDVSWWDRRAAWTSHRNVRNRVPIPADQRRICPDCGHDLWRMGKAFRAPKRSNLDGWEAAELLVMAGYEFWSGSGPLPTTAKKAREFLAERAVQTKGGRLAERLRSAKK